MPYPLLLPRGQAVRCLEFERQLAPMIGIAEPDLSAMRGKGCLAWKGCEVFATDEIAPEILDRLRAIGVELIVVGPVDWDDIETWHVEAMKRLPIMRWMNSTWTTDGAILLQAGMAGKDSRVVKKWLGNAWGSHVIMRRGTKWGPLYSPHQRYHNTRKPRHGKNAASRAGDQPTEAEPTGAGVAGG